MGKKGFIKKKVDLTANPIDTPEQRAGFIGKFIGTTQLHSFAQRKAMGIPATIDRSDLKPGKMAIAGFTGTWDYYDKAKWSGMLNLLGKTIGLLADATHKHFSGIPGMTVIPFSEVVNSTAYKNLKYSEKSKQRLRGDYIATPHNLKDISFTTMDALGQMKDLGKALGVDYVIVGRVGIFLDKGIKGTSFTPYIYEINIEVFSTQEAKEIWSFEFPKRGQFPLNIITDTGLMENMGALVPAIVDIKETGDTVSAMFGYHTYQADFGELGIQIPVTYEKLAMVVAQKFQQDMGQ